ncbi:DsbA family protein [Candidatus Kaiserbacteria bacterium]|nr:MAG: DsbA family protein [Candidatus Kaiserbacteria bacterium]
MPEETTPPQPTRPPQAPRNALGVPIAIVFSALLIAGAIVYSGNSNGGNPTQIGNAKPGTEQVTGKMEVAPVTEKDHIYGNPNAPIMIVEYSDFDCPFCKNFHETMQKIMETYGKDGKVAWVYRQFPLKQLHPNAPKVAAASECVASLGGNDAFWKFANLLISDRGVNEPSNLAKLPEYAVSAGVDKAKFTSCVEAGTFDAKITADVEAAIKAGAKGTPYSVMIVGDQQGPIDGAQPYDVVKKMIDTMLTQLSGDVAE